MPRQYDPGMIEAVAGIVGVILGAALSSVWWMSRRTRAQAELANAQASAQSLNDQLNGMRGELDRARSENAQVNAARERAEKDSVGLRKEMEARQQQFQEQKTLLAQAEQKLTDAFAALSAKSLAVNNEQFLALARKSFEVVITEAKGDVDKKQQAIDNLLKPIREALDVHAKAVGEIEKKREGAYTRLDEQIKAIATAHGELRNETGRLVTALRRPEVRGRWGEMQLKNVVELAGMTAHCDFVEQSSVQGEDGALRPDMIVRVPRGGEIIIDAKVALNAYLDSLQPDADRDACMRNHARQTADHARKLGAKKYWDQFKNTPNVVVMFMPLESALAAALDVQPDLQAEAMRSSVLIATPISLLGLLHAIAYGWQQETEAENARKIADAGAELYARLAALASAVGKVGDAVSKTANEYNKLVGTLESRVLPGARRLKELQALPDEEIPEGRAVEVEVRPIVHPELQMLPTTVTTTSSHSQAK